MDFGTADIEDWVSVTRYCGGTGRPRAAIERLLESACQARKRNSRLLISMGIVLIFQTNEESISLSRLI